VQTKTLQHTVTFKASPQEVLRHVDGFEETRVVIGRACQISKKVDGWLAATRVPLAAKEAVARLIGTDSTQEVNLAQCRPQHIRKVELTVHALPKQKT
jgi:hypothetical protein